AEYDRPAQACLLAGGEDLAVADPPLLQPRVDPRPLDALHAIRALLHHPPRAHGDVGVEGHLLGIGVIGRIREEVEPPPLVRAVARAVPGSHAALVDNAVESVVAVP